MIVFLIYLIGVPTTKKMPLTGTPLNGKDTYKKILYYFTTTDITPEQINNEGEKQLKLFYNQVKRGAFVISVLEFWRGGEEMYNCICIMYMYNVK